MFYLFPQLALFLMIAIGMSEDMYVISDFSLENGLERAGSKVVASSAGYLVGKKVERYANSKLNTFGESLKTEPIYPGSYIFKYKDPSYLPILFGNAADSTGIKFLEYKHEENNMLNKDKK